MASVSSFTFNSSGFSYPTLNTSCPRLTFQSRYLNVCRMNVYDQGKQLFPQRIPKFLQRSIRMECCLSASRTQQHFINDESNSEPLWLTLVKEAIWAMKALIAFLVQQPSQLKYIEWPSFQNTLRTAILTLILVALLIVALSSVDSALSFLLALFLRRKA